MRYNSSYALHPTINDPLGTALGRTLEESSLVRMSKFKVLYCNFALTRLDARD